MKSLIAAAYAQHAQDWQRDMGSSMGLVSAELVRAAGAQTAGSVYGESARADLLGALDLAVALAKTMTTFLEAVREHVRSEAR